MDEELSQQTFQSRIGYINKIYTYQDIKQDNDYVMIVAHQHLGLVNYVRLIAHRLSNNSMSIVIPNLFIIESAIDTQQDDIDFVKNLNPAIVVNMLFQLAMHFQKLNKKIILVGFSIGAAVSLKFLQFYKNIQFAMLFYGFPFLQTVKPQRIQTKTMIYVGKDDKMKYLSDKKMIEAAKNIYSSNQLIKIIEFSSASHGFMNPLCPKYDKKLFDQCAKEFQANFQLSKQLKHQKEQLKRIKSKNTIQSNVSILKNQQGQLNSNQQIQGRNEQGNKQEEKGGCIIM